MTDINQWRRKIHPPRAKTPSVVADSEDRDRFSDIGSNPPPTPLTRRPVMPRLSNYFNNRSTLNLTKKSSPNETRSVPEDVYEFSNPDPNPDQLVDLLMTRLLSHPGSALPTHQNSALLHVFEAYRNLKDEQVELTKQLEEERVNHQATREAHANVKTIWEAQEQKYQAELKRIEVYVANKTEDGMADVMKLRQNSVLKRKGARKLSKPPEDPLDGRDGETVFEFLQSTRRNEEDFMRGHQRVLVRPPPISNSQSSKFPSLSKKVSMMSFHAALPFGTPPSTGKSHGLKAVQSFSGLSSLGAYNTAEGSATGARRSSQSSSGLSSIEGDDNVEDTTIGFASGTSMLVPETVLSDDEHSDFNSAFSSNGDPLPDEIENSRPPTSASASNEQEYSQTLHRPLPAESIYSRRSSYAPTLRTDVNRGNHEKRFSFEPGDDHDLQSLPEEPCTASGLFSEQTPASLVNFHHSMARPFSRESTPSSPMDQHPKSNRHTLIPSPVQDVPGARLRSHREDSQSSLLTTIHHSPQDTPSPRSESSFRFSSAPSATRRSSDRSTSTTNRNSLSTVPASSAQRLNEQRMSLRNAPTAAALAAAKAATADGSSPARPRHVTPSSDCSAERRASSSSARPENKRMHSDRSENTNPRHRSSAEKGKQKRNTLILSNVDMNRVRPHSSGQNGGES